MLAVKQIQKKTKKKTMYLNFQFISLSQFTHKVSSSVIQNPLKYLYFHPLSPVDRTKGSMFY